jgi:uncharacterized protein YunC (DUF1805 family)
MRNVEVEIDGKKTMGLEVELPKAPLVLVYGDKGFVMCGYLNVDVAEQKGIAAAMVKGVSTVGDLLEAKVQGVTKQAVQKGVSVGMTGRQAMKRLL